MNRSKPIGIIDTGVGGLTTVAELQRLLPGEDIVYLGDSARNPYGNRPADEIVGMTCEMMDFLAKTGVKAVAVACNTISTMLDRFASGYDFPILGIVEPVCGQVAKRNLPVVGVLATVATIQNGAYQRLIAGHNPNIRVFGQGSPLLASLVDRGDFDQTAIDAEIKEHVGALLGMAPMWHIVLGCTHYPIVRESFERLYPDIEFIDPARDQAAAVRGLLAEQDGQSEKRDGGGFIVCTTGDVGVYADVCKRLCCKTPGELRPVRL